ncbi:hypothetical protein Bca52824_009430 [Brassica carinata]|uniref:Uncharacterized protein n=1 Tax=Brassica carinata TaxID=52824 RepID=A0A8X7WCA0_BRACI|nr:hypothetical protein Bca52824_009430 [Brassica carinata]
MTFSASQFYLLKAGLKHEALHLMKTSLDVSAVAVQPESFREAVAYSQRLFKFMVGMIVRKRCDRC